MEMQEGELPSSEFTPEDHRHKCLTHLKMVLGDRFPPHLQRELEEHQAGGSLMVPVYNTMGGKGLFDFIKRIVPKVFRGVVAAAPSIIAGNPISAVAAGANAFLNGSGLRDRQEEVSRSLRELKV